MKTIVIYKSKYGSTESYAHWIAEELDCDALESSKIKAEELSAYDTIIYGGGLYAEVIVGVTLITKNIDKLMDKKLIVYTTGITPMDCRDYHEKYVVEKNFKNGIYDKIKMFNFPGKMILSELTMVHRTAIKTLRKIMSDKKNPTEMEKMLIDLCDADGDFTDRTLIGELVKYAQDN